MNLFLHEDGRLRVGWRFAFSVLVVVLVDFVAGTLASTFAGTHPRIEELVYTVLLLFLLLGCFVGMVKLFDQPEGNLNDYLGLPCKGWFRQTFTGALLGFVLIFLAVIAIAIFFHYQIVRMLLTPRTAALPAVVTVSVLAGAMAEELSFRGYPFQRLVEGIGKTGAVIVLSIFFGAVHLMNPHVSDNRAVEIFAFSNTVLIGIVLAVAYLRTRALWFSWGLHFSWNFTMGVIFGMPVSGLNDFSVLVRARARGPDWLLGGSYGLEGGLLGTLLALLGLIYVVVFLRPLSLANLPSQLDEAPSSSIQSAGNG